MAHINVARGTVCNHNGQPIIVTTQYGCRLTGCEEMCEELHLMISTRAHLHANLANPNLIRLFAVLMSCLAFKAVRAVHILCFVVSAIDKHPLWIQPCALRQT